MTQELKDALVEELGYTPQGADKVIEELEDLSPCLRDKLDRWLAGRTEEDAEQFHGYSVNSLRETYEMNFIAALLTLDWVIKAPEEAVPALEDGIA